jgi:hypothetical protein
MILLGRGLALVAGVASLGTEVVGAQTPADFEAMGEVLASEFDDINGPAVSVLTAYGCSPYLGCLAEEPSSAEEEAKARSLAIGFSRALGLELDTVGGGMPECEWAPITGQEPLGLRAQFGGIKSLGDSVQILMTASCLRHGTPSDERPRGFAQGQIYFLAKNSDGEWEVVGYGARRAT